jgi:hypothetical protein
MTSPFSPPRYQGVFILGAVFLIYFGYLKDYRLKAQKHEADLQKLHEPAADGRATSHV